jgi:predicted MFS family arabinose efflux permease
MPRTTEGLLRFLRHNSLWVLAVCVGSGIAHIGTSTMPFQVGALMDGTGLAPSQAGLFGFVEVGSLAGGMILIAPWIDRIHPTLIGFVSAALAGIANLGLYLIHGFSFELACGALSGLGFGFIFAATIAGAAAADDPDRLYAIGNGGALLLIVGIMAIVPLIARLFGPLGIFVSIAALAIVGSVFFVGFRRGRASAAGRPAAWRVPGAAGLLCSWASFSLGTGALYAFSERIAKGLHIAPDAIGYVLSTGVLVGLAGTFAAALFSTRLNRRVALIGGMVGTSLSCLLLGYAMNLPMFTAGVFTYWISYMFLYSYLLGTAALLDDSGRIGTFGGGLERLGYGSGAWIGGILAEHHGYSVTGLLGFAGCLIGMAAGFPSLFKAIERRHLESSQGSLRPLAVDAS